jgi:hypothetical protein
LSRRQCNDPEDRTFNNGPEIIRAFLTRHDKLEILSHGQSQDRRLSKANRSLWLIANSDDQVFWPQPVQSLGHECRERLTFDTSAKFAQQAQPNRNRIAPHRQ